MPEAPTPSPDAARIAVEHELQETQARVLALRQELYGWQEECNRLISRIAECEDELDYLWNRQE